MRLEFTDDELRAALEVAFVPPLLPTVAQVVGDDGVLLEELRPPAGRSREIQGGLTDEQMARTREVAFDALRAHRDRGCEVGPPDLGDERLRRLVEYTIGEPVGDDYLPLLREEIGLAGADLRAPRWELQPDDRPGLRAVVIGAGMSGILAGHRLAQAGIPYEIVEKNHDVGGTWLENSYPGCRVDVANHFYSYSFARRDWPQHFSDRDVLWQYFAECADEFGVRDHVRFSTEVVAAVWDEAAAVWEVEVEGPDGEREVLTAPILISAVGQLNRPKMPDIDGIDRFDGEWFHSARWDHDVDLDAKRVAVIGTGCSAAQFVPIVADQAAELTVFQRTPPWLVPTPEYHDDIDPGLHWLFSNVPYYEEWYRIWLFWRSAEGMLASATLDPDWDVSERSVSAANEEIRELLTLYLQVLVPDDPELLAKLTPNYPPGAKRIVRDNGVWVEALRRDHVSLVTDGVTRITERGVIDGNGVEHEVDVIIYGTGFEASKFLTPMKVVGRGGADLHARWGGDARAYLGITIPDFPNFFCLYGPNTNIVVNGSIIWFSECEMTYVLDCVHQLVERGAAAMACRPEVHDRYAAWIDEGNAKMAWGYSSVSSWYKSESGRVAQNWPYSMLEFWRRTRACDPEDYVWT